MNQTALPYEVIRLSSFQEELTAIANYLTENVSYKVALQLAEDIQSQIDIISIHPYLYPAYTPVPRFRKMPIQNWQYVAFYTVNKQKRRIAMANIFHTARDVYSLLRHKKRAGTSGSSDL